MTLAVIGGTGLSQFDEWPVKQRHQVKTDFGEPSAAIIEISTPKGKVFFLPRHGETHSIAPHQINYRANIAALHSLGVTDIIAIAAVGGITAELAPGTLVCPDQLIDYTYGRKQTFFEQEFAANKHIDFSYPYDATLRKVILKGSSNAVLDGGTYGATQGPRLETAAEIKRLAQDGCTMVGMTGMPEAALARELGLNYACLALVVNWAAGLTGEVITMNDIEQVLHKGQQKIREQLVEIMKAG